MSHPRIPSLPADSLAFALQQAALVLNGVFAGQSLADGAVAKVPAPARPAVQDLVYGSLRAWGRGDFFLQRLLARPLEAPEVRALLLVALYRLETRPDSEYVVVDQAVEAAGTLAGGRFRGLVNAVLRNAQRQRSEILAALAADPALALATPPWWLARLQADWPGDWQRIAEAGMTQPPMALRVNARQGSRAEYMAQLAAVGLDGKAVAADGIALAQPVPVERLPDFAGGRVSVQDPGAQAAADWLAPQAGERVLDACAAPGGKTAHLLERAEIDLTALDLKPARCRRITENLTRLGLEARVLVGDATRPSQWWDGQLFDAILADVPCSASGVVRRHPDAKWLRQPGDVESFAAAQRRIIDVLWSLLRPGGRMLYATCSVFAAENAAQVAAFLTRHPDARCTRQAQLLPDADSDGFFYALVEKHA